MLGKKLVASALAVAMSVSTFAIGNGTGIGVSKANAHTDGPYLTGNVSGLSVQEIVKEMGIGWNLGNALECSGINFLDQAEKDKNLSEWYETGWSNPVTTKAMIDKVKKEGFNTIRIPVTWGEKVGAAPDYKIDKRWMDRVKEVISWAYDNDMFVILNTHHEEMTGFEDTDKKTTPDNLKYKSGWLRLENYESTSKQLKAIWKQLATEFADYDQHLIFEVLNEPRYVDENGVQDWDGDGVTGNSTKVWFDVINKLNADGLNTIRSIKGNEDRAVMLPTYAAQLKDPAIRNFEIPNNDKQVMVSIHAYEPYKLCLAKGDEGEEYITEFNEEGKQLLDEKFALLDKYFVSKNIPVVIGETSITNRNNPEDRREWCKYYATLARERNIPLVMWDANKFGKDNPKVGENHGWLNRNLMKWYDKETTDTLVYTYYGYDIPSSDEYVPEEDLEPTSSKFNIHTVWSGRASATDWGQCTTINIPTDGITGRDMMKEGTLIEIDYDPSEGGAPHLVFYQMSPNRWVDIYPTDMDVVNGKAYFAYPTIMNTWKGLTGSSDYSGINQIFPAAAFTDVTATAVKICIPKSGANIPDPFIDPYEDFNFWDEHTVHGVNDGHTHEYTSTVTKAATCTEDGVMTYTCECGKSYTEVIEATGHSFGAWEVLKPATCLATGIQTRTCSKCDEIESKKIDKTNHNYVDTVVPPTTTEQGYTVHVCSICGDKKIDTFTDPVPEETKLTASVKYQYNSKHNTFRLIINVNEKDIKASNSAVLKYKVGSGSTVTENVTKIYSSFTNNGTTEAAEAGTKFIISKSISDVKKGDKIVVNLALDTYKTPYAVSFTV